MENKVMVKNLTNGRVGINKPDIHFKRVWEKKGAIKPVDFDTLQEIIYDPGVERLFTQGILYIEDMETKIKLGLEPEAAKEPTNIVVLTEAQMKRYLKVAPLQELKDLIPTLAQEQIIELVQYAIANEIIDLEKSDFLKEVSGIDIVSAIQLNRQDKEV